MSKIDLNNISHSYNPNDPNPIYALNPFSMTWENGKRYAILGPSGCGKTTMLNIVSGLVRPSAGNILFDDASVSNKFIAGEPIKYPTKVVLGLSNNSLGVPA